MGCMKSTLSEGLSGVAEGKINPQTVRTDQTHYVRDPTFNTKNNIVSSSQADGLNATILLPVTAQTIKVQRIWYFWMKNLFCICSFVVNVIYSAATPFYSEEKQKCPNQHHFLRAVWHDDEEQTVRAKYETNHNRNNSLSLLNICIVSDSKTSWFAFTEQLTATTWPGVPKDGRYASYFDTVRCSLFFIYHHFLCISLVL